MKFVFLKKNKVEMNVITDILDTEKIPYKMISKKEKTFLYDEEEDADFVIVEKFYDIHCNTDLEHFDFVKHISDKKIADRIHLERCYCKKWRRNVHKLHKKNNANTTNSNKSK